MNQSDYFILQLRKCFFVLLVLLYARRVHFTARMPQSMAPRTKYAENALVRAPEMSVSVTTASCLFFCLGSPRSPKHETC